MLIMATQAQANSNTGFRPDAPTYAIRGAFSVGAMESSIERTSPLDLTIWYPALNPNDTEASILYPYEIKMDAAPEAVATVSGKASANADFNLEAAPYPLIILSPGFSIGRSNYAYLAEHLASYGFVVLAPEHQERFDPEMSEFWQAAIKRPMDILDVLAYVDLEVQEEGIFESLVDAETVAVIGHSYGGYTALTAAGARFDMTAFQSHCDAAAKANDPNVWLCGLLLENIEDMAELAGLSALPEDLWPAWADSRIDAIIPMAGDAYLFGQSGLAEIDIPVMAIGGTLDTGTPFSWGTQPTFDHVSSTVKAKVAFENAEHMIFSSTCEALPWYSEIGFYSFCSDPVWDMDRAHDLILHFSTAFLLAELKDDEVAASSLAPESVSFPGIAYEVQGF
ncbi:MAG: hypothetical protein KC422_22215 [Trueperaceae bacterium]|nr:hypothetical protein [Trueperaceae bacterium]